MGGYRTRQGGDEEEDEDKHDGMGTTVGSWEFMVLTGRETIAAFIYLAAYIIQTVSP